jgi:hypothetical protein
VPDLGQLTGNRPSWPVSGQLAWIPPFWEDPGRTDVGGLAVLARSGQYPGQTAGSVQALGQIARDPAAPASLAGIWDGISGIRRHLPDFARFWHRLKSESGLLKSDNIQLLERKGRLRCLKESRLYLPFTENYLRF